MDSSEIPMVKWKEKHHGNVKKMFKTLLLECIIAIGSEVEVYLPF